MAVVEQSVLVAAKNGVHARPAALIVETAMKFSSEISLSNGEMPANAKSIMEIMMLSAVHGTELTLKADGDDAGNAVEALSSLFEAKFNED